MQLGLNKHLQPHEIKSYEHKIKNQTNKNKGLVDCMQVVHCESPVRQLGKQETASVTS